MFLLVNYMVSKIGQFTSILRLSIIHFLVDLDRHGKRRSGV